MLYCFEHVLETAAVWPLLKSAEQEVLEKLGQIISNALLCRDTGCYLDDLSIIMTDWDYDKTKNIHAVGTPWDIYIYIYIYFCLNFWDEACWFLSLRFFGLLFSSLLFPQRFGQYVLRPSSGVCRTWEPSRNFELRPLLKPRESPVLIPFAMTGYKY